MIRPVLLPLFLLIISITLSLTGLDFFAQEKPATQTEISLKNSFSEGAESSPNKLPDMSFGKILTQLLVILPQLLQAGIWLSTAWLINRLLTIFFWKQVAIPKLLRDIVTIIVFAIAVSGIIVITFGQPITGIWATSFGIVGLIGFALKEVILDSFIGISINLDKPYKIGDFVGIHIDAKLDVHGYIIEVSWRTTRIKTREGNYVILPNRVLGDMIVTNYMAPEPKNLQTLTFTLDFSIHPDRAIRVLSAGTKAALGKNQALEEPPPQIIVNQVNNSGIEYLIWFWIEGEAWPELPRHFVIKSIIEHLQQAGLKSDPNLPTPTAYIKENRENRVGRLAQIELFSQLPTQELQALASHVTTLFYKEKDIIVKQGEPAYTMFIIVEGLLNVFVGDSERQVKVAQMLSGEFFGELSLLTGQARTATVIAATDVILYEISKENILPLLVQKPQVAEIISKVVAERELRTSKAYEHLAKKEEKKAHTETRAKQILLAIRAYLGI